MIEKLTFEQQIKVSANYNNSKELNEFISKKSNGICLLSFSCGKDSIASWIELKKHFHTIIPVYLYTCPGLSFIEESLKYYENYFKTKIYRLPHHSFIRQLNNGMMQTKENLISTINYELPNIKSDTLFNYLKEDLNLPKQTPIAIGNRMFDNMMRFGSIRKNGATNEKKNTFYPIYDWKNEDLVNCFNENKINLPIDYKIWGCSFDGFHYPFLKPLKDNFPEDYKKIKEYFPLIDLELKRYEL